MKTLSYNYKIKPGYIGFSYNSDNIVSIGIAHLTKEEHDNVKVSHTFVVVNSEYLIESTLKEGVVYKSIEEYVYDPSIILFFKKPLGLDEQKVKIIIEEAKSHIGEKYDIGLYAYFLERLILKKLINKFSNSKKSYFFNSAKRLICSELVSICLSKVPEYNEYIPFSEYHPSKIDPQALFHSPVFQSWDYQYGD